MSGGGGGRGEHPPFLRAPEPALPQVWQRTIPDGKNKLEPYTLISTHKPCTLISTPEPYALMSHQPVRKIKRIRKRTAADNKEEEEEEEEEEEDEEGEGEEEDDEGDDGKEACPPGCEQVWRGWV